MVNDISNRFHEHGMASNESAEYTKIKRNLIDLATYISDKLVDSRETAIVLTKLEEANFWMKASISRNGLKD